MASSTPRCLGILTSGGDCQGLNAAIRAVGKTAITAHGMEVIGILDGFRGLIENRFRRLGDDELSGILTLGGTINATGRPHWPCANGACQERLALYQRPARSW